MTRCHYCLDPAYFTSDFSDHKVCGYCAMAEEEDLPRCPNHPDRLGTEKHDNDYLCPACSREEAPQDWEECHA